MSEEGSIGPIIAEKFFGLILVVIGALSMYYTILTFTGSSDLMPYLGFFAFLSIILLILGLLLIVAKTE